MTKADETNYGTEPHQTETTIDLTAQTWNLPAAGSTIFDFDYTSGRDQLAAPVRQGHAPPVGRVRPDRLVDDVDHENPLGVPDESIMIVRHAVLGTHERRVSEARSAGTRSRGSSRSSCTASRAR